MHCTTQPIRLLFRGSLAALVLLVFVQTCASSPRQAPTNWKTHTNARGHFSIACPPDADVMNDGTGIQCSFEEPFDNGQGDAGIYTLALRVRTQPNPKRTKVQDWAFQQWNDGDIEKSERVRLANTDGMRLFIRGADQHFWYIYLARANDIVEIVFDIPEGRPELVPSRQTYYAGIFEQAVRSIKFTQ